MSGATALLPQHGVSTSTPRSRSECLQQLRSRRFPARPGDHGGKDDSRTRRRSIEDFDRGHGACASVPFHKTTDDSCVVRAVKGGARWERRAWSRELFDAAPSLDRVTRPKCRRSGIHAASTLRPFHCGSPASVPRRRQGQIPAKKNLMRNAGKMRYRVPGSLWEGLSDCRRHAFHQRMVGAFPR